MLVSLLTQEGHYAFDLINMAEVFRSWCYKSHSALMCGLPWTKVKRPPHAGERAVLPVQFIVNAQGRV